MAMRGVVVVGLGVVLLACQSGAAIGTTCARGSDCASPLVCRLGRCRTECSAARDCPAGQACLVAADGLGACELPAVDVCSLSCDAPLICASGHCRVECTTDAACPGGHVCRGGACQRTDAVADAGPDDAGAADAGSDASLDAARGDGGLRCDPIADTGCGAGERCAVGTGVPACVAGGGTLTLGQPCTGDAQCGDGLSCQGDRCVRMCLVGVTDCGTDLTCSYSSVHGQARLPPENGIGLCTEACDPSHDTGCPSGATCGVGVDLTGRDFTWCRDIGSVQDLGACAAEYECAAGLRCFVDTCRPICDVATGTCAVGTCEGSTAFLGRPQVGACVP